MTAPYEHDGVVSLMGYRIHKDVYLRLIRAFKNPLVGASNEEFARAKYEVAKGLLATPGNIGLKMQWQMLMDLEGDRK